MKNVSEEDETFLDRESLDLRKNYYRSINGKAQQSSKEKSRAKIILVVLILLYVISMLTFIHQIYNNAALRLQCFEIITELGENGNIKGAFLIGFVGYIIVLSGFNVVLFDVMAGFILRPFWYGFLVITITKSLAKYSGFILGRYCLRSFIYKALSSNIYFITCYLAAKKKPIKMMFAIQFMTIPTFLKTYACGLFQITHFEYLYPTLFGTTVWVGFWVYVGSKLDNIMELLKTGDTGQLMPWYIEVGLFLVLVLIVFQSCREITKIYAKLKLDVKLDNQEDIYLEHTKVYEFKEKQGILPSSDTEEFLEMI